MYIKKTKKILSILLIFGLIFTTGAFSFADGSGLPDGHYWINVTGGTASVEYAKPGDVVTVTLDPGQVPDDKRFMIWQLGKFVEFIESRPYFLRISDLSISRMENNIGKLQVTMRINTLFLK